MSALVSVALMNRESGVYRGKRRTSKNPNLTLHGNDVHDTIQLNPIFIREYQGLVDKGKPKKVAIVACMRKMIANLNSMVKKGEVWDEKLD